MIVDLHFGKNKEFTLSYKLYDNAVSKRLFKDYNSKKRLTK